MNVAAIIAAVILLAGCDQVAYRAVGAIPEPAQRADHVPFDTVATITIAGPRDRVERILHLIVDRDPKVMTAAEIKVVD